MGVYSILIKTGEKSFTYYTNTDGTQFSGDETAVKAKLQELLETYALGKLAVVHNVNLSADFTIEDVA